MQDLDLDNDNYADLDIDIDDFIVWLETAINCKKGDD